MRDNLLKRWFGTAEAFTKGEARGGQGFRAVTGLNLEYHRLAISGATELGRSLAADLENPQTDYNRLSSLGSALTVLAAKMEPQAAAEIAKGLAAALENPQETSSNRLPILGNALAALAANGTAGCSGDRKGPCGGLGESAGNGFKPSFDPWQCSGGTGGCKKWNRRLQRRSQDEAPSVLLRFLENWQERNIDRLLSLGNALAALAAKTEPQAAAERYGRLAAALENPQETDSNLVFGPLAVLW